MDAISFVLGVRTAHLRGSLGELLYKFSNSQSQAPLTAEDTPTTGFVQLVYVTGTATISCGRLPRLSAGVYPAGACISGMC